MDDEKDLRGLLERLHTEIENTDTMDDEGRELLQHLSADIRLLLARTDDEETQAESSMIERMEESVDRYEVTHPDLTMLLTKVLSILSNAGI